MPIIRLDLVNTVSQHPEMLTWQEVIKESLETVKFVVAVAAPVVAGLGAAFFGYYSTRQKRSGIDGSTC